MLKAVYDKYHAQGFEIVGICALLNPKKETAEIAQARAILGKTGAAEYTNGFLGGSARRDFWMKYSIVYNPVTWLLNQDGKLVKNISTDEIRGKGLEQDVRKLLGLPPLPTIGI